MATVPTAALAGICSSAGYLKTLNITNINPGYCFGNGTNSYACSDSPYTGFNITAAVLPGETTPAANWSFVPISRSPELFPLNKPLTIECPMPICTYGVSGFYSPLQRYLFYANIVLAYTAGWVPILRGIAAIYVTTMSFVSVFLLFGTFARMFPYDPAPYADMDRFVAAAYWCWCFIFVTSWIFLRRSLRGTIILTGGGLRGEGAVAADIVQGTSDKYARRQTLAFSYAFLAFGIFWIIAFTTTVAGGWGMSLPNVPAVLLESDTGYRIAGPCYQSNPDTTVMWDSTVKTQIFRQASELQLQIPALPNSSPLTLDAVAGVSLYAQTPVPGWKYLVWIALPWVTTLLIALPLVKILGCVTSGKTDWHPLLKYTPLVSQFASGVWVVASLEWGFHSNNSPQSEQAFQIGQWSGWAIAAMLVIAALVAKYLGFEHKPDDEKRTLASQPRRERADKHPPSSTGIAELQPLTLRL